MREVPLRKTCLSVIALILFSALCHAENLIPVMTDGEPYMMEYDADSVTRSGSVVHLQTKITDSVNGTVLRYSMEIDCQKLNARNTRVAMYDPGADSPYFENDIDLPIPDIPGSFHGPVHSHDVRISGQYDVILQSIKKPRHRGD